MNPSSPFRSTLNTSYITGLDMCKVWTEAVHSVGVWSRHFGCWPLVVEFDSFGCWTLGCWSGVLVVESGVLVVESGSFGCWTLGCWRLWLLNPGFWLLNPALLVAEALVVEFFGCWNRLFWLLKLWLLNPAVLVVESGFFGCWILLSWLLKPWLLNLLVVETGFFGCWSYSCWIRRHGCWIRRFGCWTLVVESGLVVETGFVLGRRLPMAAFGPRVFYWWCDHYESAGHLHHLCDPQSHQLSSPNAQPTAAAWFMEEGAHSEVLVLAAKKEANSIWPYGMCRESITWTLQCNRCSILCAVLFGMFAGLGKIPQKALTKTAGQKNYENLGNQTIGQPNTDVSSLSR